MVVQSQTKDHHLVECLTHLNKRCKLGDLTNYMSNASNLQNVIRSIPAYDSVLGKRQDKAVWQVLSTKTSKRKLESQNLLMYCT